MVCKGSKRDWLTPGFSYLALDKTAARAHFCMTCTNYCLIRASALDGRYFGGIGASGIFRPILSLVAVHVVVRLALLAMAIEIHN